MCASRFSWESAVTVLVITTGAILPGRAEAGVRKKESTLSAAEKTAFINALRAVKASGDYDTLVNKHLTYGGGGANKAHQGPAFCAWHRQFLLELEGLLQAQNAAVTIPYWDWTIDPFPSWLGGNGCQDTAGEPFSDVNGWNVVAPYDDDMDSDSDPDCGPTSTALYRTFGVHQPSLPTAAEVTAMLSRPTFDLANWNRNSSTSDNAGTPAFVEGSFRNYLEGWSGTSSRMHNGVHEYVGGNMRLGTSPDDPVFFLHHANVDRLWCKWQVQWFGTFHHLPVAGDHDPQARADIAPDGHNAYDDLIAFAGTVTAYDLINMQALGYSYDDCSGPCIETGWEEGSRTTSQIMMDQNL